MIEIYQLFSSKEKKKKTFRGCTLKYLFVIINVDCACDIAYQDDEPIADDMVATVDSTPDSSLRLPGN